MLGIHSFLFFFPCFASVGYFWLLHSSYSHKAIFGKVFGWGGQARARFLLKGKEDGNEAALASASVLFSGLTILSPQQPSASWELGWG